MSKNFIYVENVSYKYENSEEFALKDIDLEISEGEFIAIIGTNGSGKSTLAKHFNALLLPTNGKILVDGFDTSQENDLWKIRSKVGMVFQNPDNQLIAAIVEDDIAFGPENLGISEEEIKQRVDLSLDAVNMKQFKNFAPHKLSGGQKQRIAIAGALALKTKCIVFDEPTAMLDPQGRSEVLSTVKKLHDSKELTVIYITHFMEEAIYADRIVVMEHGRIKKIGTPREIFSEVEEVKKIGLDVPIAAEICYRLNKKKFNLPKNILNAEELAKFIKKS